MCQAPFLMFYRYDQIHSLQALRDGPFCYPDFPDEKTEVQREVVSPAWSHRLVRGKLTPGARLLAPLLYCFSDEPLKPWKPWKNKQAGVRLSWDKQSRIEGAGWQLNKIVQMKIASFELLGQITHFLASLGPDTSRLEVRIRSPEGGNLRGRSCWWRFQAWFADLGQGQALFSGPSFLEQPPAQGRGAWLPNPYMSCGWGILIGSLSSCPLCH